MKYIIYADIDGTFYTHDQKINQDTIKDIAFAQKHGVTFVLATGNALLKQITYVTEVSGADYFIGSNGALIKNLKTGEIIHEDRMDNDIAQKIADVADKYELGIDCWDDKEVFVYDNGYYPEETINTLERVILKDIRPTMSRNMQVRPYKMEYVTKGPKENIDKAIEEISGLDLTIARISDKHCEITKKGVSKGHAIKILNEKLGFSLEDTMAIGDSGNDKSMFDIVNYSYLMADSKPNMIGSTKYHTSSPLQNGLGEAIRDFMYRNKID